MLLVVHIAGVMQILQSVTLRVFWYYFSMLIFRQGQDIYIQAELSRRGVSGATSKRESTSLVLPCSSLIYIFISSSNLFSLRFSDQNFLCIYRVSHPYCMAPYSSSTLICSACLSGEEYSLSAPSSPPILMIDITLETYKTAGKIFGENCELRHIAEPFSSSSYVIFNFLFPLNTFCSNIPVPCLVWKREYEC